MVKDSVRKSIKNYIKVWIKNNKYERLLIESELSVSYFCFVFELVVIQVFVISTIEV